MGRFEFSTAHRIIFGPGTSREIGPLAREWGSRALLLTSRSAAGAADLAKTLNQAGITTIGVTAVGEPTTPMVEAAAQQARAENCQFVIGMGGGSVMDAAKAVAALLTNQGGPLDYLEVVGQGKPLERSAAPCVAIPTTAGTGAEVTRNAVLAVPAHRLKASLRHHSLLPRLALVDPDLIRSVPAAVIAATGLDALTQLIEPLVCNRSNPITDALCLEGMQRVARSLGRLFADPSDANAREDMALASLFSGLALANAGLGAVHGLAAPIGGTFTAPHGAVCAALLAPVMEANIRALRARQPASPSLTRYEWVALRLTGRSVASPEEAVAWVRRLCRELNIRGLGAWGVAASDIPELSAKAAQASSMKANPLPLTLDEIQQAVMVAL